jgi:hypothetical protein
MIHQGRVLLTVCFGVAEFSFCCGTLSSCYQVYCDILPDHVASDEARTLPKLDDFTIAALLAAATSLDWEESSYGRIYCVVL